MIRRTFIKRFSTAVLGCGMLAEALLSRGPSMLVQERVFESAYVGGRGPGKSDVFGPRVVDRVDLDYKYENRLGVVVELGMPS